MSQAEGVIGVGLVDLKAQRRLSVAGIEADDGETASAQIERQPIGELPGLKADPDGRRGIFPHRAGDRVRGRRALAAPDHGALIVDDAD